MELKSNQSILESFKFYRSLNPLLLSIFYLDHFPTLSPRLCHSSQGGLKDINTNMVTKIVIIFPSSFYSPFVEDVDKFPENFFSVHGLQFSWGKKDLCQKEGEEHPQECFSSDLWLKFPQQTPLLAVKKIGS